MAGDGFTGIYWFKSFKWFKKFKPFSSIRRIGRFELLERFERLEPFESLLPRLPDLQHPFLRFFLLGSHCGIGIGEAILFSRYALLLRHDLADRNVGAERLPINGRN
jgi:hypothetical protein